MTAHGAQLLLTIALGGAAATFAWRLAGVVLVRRIGADTPAFMLVRAVATSLVAALVSRMIFFPSGLLAQTALWTRLAAMACGFGVWLWAGRRIEYAVAAAVVAFFALQLAG